MEKYSKSVYIAYTGGTIGMKKARDGYVPVAGYLEQRMAEMPEFHSDGMPDYIVHEYDPLLDSANMTPIDWVRMATDIVENYDYYDGFIIIHGTDTMAYSAAALSFMLENVAKPVIFTGSQIPLAEIRSDARENLITALLIAANYTIPEVCLYLNGRLLRGNRARKVNASGFDAFDSPNYPSLGEVGVRIDIRWERVLLVEAAASCRLYPLSLNTTIASLRLFPGISAPLVQRFLAYPPKGLVLETYGAGNAPENNHNLLAVLAQATQNGVVIVNCTQCLRGSVDMGDYATGDALRRAGVISGYDMTPEAALTKLYYLFGLGLSTDEIKVRMQKNLRGELTLPSSG